MIIGGVFITILLLSILGAMFTIDQELSYGEENEKEL